MTPRERVFAALEFKSPDRAPRDLWALPWVSMFARDDFDAVCERFPGDFASASALAPGDRVRGEPARKGKSVDEWGCVFEVAEDGVVGEVTHPPLADWSSLAEFTCPWEIIEHADFDAVDRALEAERSGADRFMRCGTSIRPFERLQFLRGSQNLFLDLGYQSAELLMLIGRIHEFYLKELTGWCRTAADGISFMDDWGTQRSLLISPDQWRTIFKPLYRDYCEMIHAAGKKVFFHSDGHIFDIYEDLIEIGVDAVNSQLFCMDIEEIARRFAGRITFWGEIDRQHVLPFGTPADARAAVRRVRRALDTGQGGLIAQCEWGVGNPRANVEAVFEAWDGPMEA